MKNNCQCVSCGDRFLCEEMKEGLCMECQKMLEELEKEEIDFEILQQEIEEGDFCICNFHDCALKFWFKRDQILKTVTVQKLTRTPNILRFEGVDNDEGFYANSFYKVKIL